MNSPKKTVKQLTQELHMTADQIGWFNGKRIIPFAEMTDESLQRAKLHAQRKELYFFNRAQVFSELSERIDNEAKKRGKILKDHNTQFHKNSRMLREAIVAV